MLALCRLYVSAVPRAITNTGPRCAIRSYVSEARSSARKGARGVMDKTAKPTLKERLMAPAGDSAFSMGRGFAAGASVLGMGALCFYGMGLSNEVGAIDRASLWPEVVTARIRDTYMYFGGGIAVTAATAVAAARNSTLMRLTQRNSLLALGASMALIIGSNMVTRSIPYEKGFGKKQLAWMAHAAIIGTIIAPITVLGGPLLVRAAVYTAGIVGGLSTVAMCAPSEKFLYMGGPLAIGFGLVFASSMAGFFLPPTSALGAGLYSISIYGGLVLFGLFLLYDTQKIIKRAETHPTYGMVPYDPVNASLGIFADTLNIFIRMVAILQGGGGRKK